MKFKDSDLEKFWEQALPPRHVPSEIRKAVYRKLQILDAAAELSDLRAPPGNRLEKLGGDREGQHSIRVNEQWRLCFIWSGGEAKEVEFCDYH